MADQRDDRLAVLCTGGEIVHLTGRQTEVLQLAGRGLPNKQIARRMGISVRTVEDHFSAIRLRTGAHSRSELVPYQATFARSTMRRSLSS